jgi:tetratricopeptide (TPR) repeat protein
MGDQVNSYGSEFRSFVTHDGRYFFFGSTRNAAVPKGEMFLAEAATKYGDNDVYWVDASLISELEETALTKSDGAEIVRQELQSRGLQAAIDKLQELHAVGEELYTFSLFELLDLCSRLLDEGRAKDAGAFYTVLGETFDTFRVQNGYAMILANHGQLEQALSLLEDLENAGEAIDLPASLDYLYYDLKARGHMEDAIRALRAKIERFPDSYHAYCYLAEMYASRGEVDKAKAACETVIKVNPGFKEARELLKKLAS